MSTSMTWCGKDMKRQLWKWPMGNHRSQERRWGMRQKRRALSKENADQGSSWDTSTCCYRCSRCNSWGYISGVWCWWRYSEFLCNKTDAIYTSNILTRTPEAIKDDRINEASLLCTQAHLLLTRNSLKTLLHTELRLKGHWPQIEIDL